MGITVAWSRLGIGAIVGFLIGWLIFGLLGAVVLALIIMVLMGIIKISPPIVETQNSQH